MKEKMVQIRTRKTWMLGIVSFAAALLVMLLFYIRGMPEIPVNLYFQPELAQNPSSLGNELRINYIMVDDKFLPLKEYADQSSWSYDGALFTQGNFDALSVTVTARRYLEISMKRGTWMGCGAVDINGEKQEFDFYESDDNLEQIIRYPIRPFLNLRTIIAGCIAFCCSFPLLCYLSKRVIVSPHWDAAVNCRDILIGVSILVLSILFCSNWADRIGGKGIYFNMDIGIYVAGGKKILNGITPYLQHYEEKGPILLLLCALGEWIWFPWGIHILTVALFAVGMFFLYRSMRQLFSRYVSLLSILFAVLLCKNYNVGGINTEILSVPFICVSLYIFVCFLRKGDIGAGWLLICGSCFAAVLMMRVSNAWLWVVGVPVLLYITWKRGGNAIQKLCIMGAGVMIVLLPIIIWLWMNGAVDEWITDTILYFRYYKSDIGFVQKIMNGVQTLNETRLKGWYFIPIVVISLDILLRSSKNRTQYPIKFLVYGAGLLGFYCSALSGYTWPHNVLMLFPIFAFMGAYFIEYMQKMLQPNSIAASLAPIMLLTAAASEPFVDLMKEALPFSACFESQRLQIMQISNYIESSSDGAVDVIVYATDGGLGAMLQNTFVKSNVCTYAYLPYDETLKQMHMQKYMDELSTHSGFFASGRNIDPNVAAYVHDNYHLVLETADYLLYQHNAFSGL